MHARRQADSMEAVLVRAYLGVAAAVLIGGAAAAQTPAPATPSAADAAAAPAQAEAMNQIAAATSPAADPWERTNRKFYGIHQSIDRAALRPAALGYKKSLPSQARKGLRNAIQNVAEPVVIINYIFQLRFGRAARSFTRFAGNSTVGIGGFIDIAGKTGLPHEDNDFGMTLAHYGAKSGPYIFLPLVGPSTQRDLAGKTVDIFLDPFTWIAFPGRFVMNTSRILVGGLDTRAEYDPILVQIESTATDPYATLRSLYLQNRQSQVGGGEIDLNALPDFDDPGAAPAGDSAPQPAPPPT